MRVGRWSEMLVESKGGLWRLWDEGLSRIDQALEEADCATFEDAGTITLLGSRLASGRKPNNERKSALIFAQEVRLRLLLS